MPILRLENALEMSQAAAAIVIRAVQADPNLLLCLATGGSPVGLYEALSKDAAILKSRIRCLALDEWYGISSDHPSSCSHFLNQHVFQPWQIPPEQRIVFNPSARDPEAECRLMADRLAREGPIDLCILGLGRNGHIGLNEPSAHLLPNAHVATLDPTSQAHAMLQENGVRLTRGMTYGMVDILHAREIILLVTGSGKAAIFEQWLSGKITTRLPASLLHLHPRLHVLVDLDTVH